MITRVAIQFQGQVYSLPRPCRHKDVMQMIFDTTHQLVADEIYGFLDDQDNFLDRKAALMHAQACGQLHDSNHHPSLLFSEDLWFDAPLPSDDLD